MSEEHKCYRCDTPMDIISEKHNVDGYNVIIEYKCPKCGTGTLAMGCMG